MFYLAFAVSNNLFMTWANFEEYIYKFGRLKFVEQKCPPLNLNMPPAEYKSEPFNALI